MSVPQVRDLTFELGFEVEIQHDFTSFWLFMSKSFGHSAPLLEFNVLFQKISILPHRGFLGLTPPPPPPPKFSFILSKFWPFRPPSHSEFQMTFCGRVWIFSRTAQCLISMVKGRVTILPFCSVQKQLCPVACHYSCCQFFHLS